MDEKFWLEVLLCVARMFVHEIEDIWTYDVWVWICRYYVNCLHPMAPHLAFSPRRVWLLWLYGHWLSVGAHWSSHYHNAAALQLLSPVTWADLTITTHHARCVCVVVYCTGGNVKMRAGGCKYIFMTVIIPTLSSNTAQLWSASHITMVCLG